MSRDSQARPPHSIFSRASLTQIRCSKYVALMDSIYIHTNSIEMSGITCGRMTTHMGARVGMADSSVRRISEPLDPYQVLLSHMDVNGDVETKKNLWAGNPRVHQAVCQVGEICPQCS